MAAKLYRVLNDEETIGVEYNSLINLSGRKRTVKDLFQQFETVCKLSEDCDIRISQSLVITGQYNFVIDKIRAHLTSGVFEIKYLIESNEDSTTRNGDPDAYCVFPGYQRYFKLSLVKFKKES